MNKILRAVVVCALVVAMPFLWSVIQFRPGYDIAIKSLFGVATNSGLKEATTAFYVKTERCVGKYGDLVGSGVFLGADVEGERRIFVATAGHVAQSLLRAPAVQLTIKRKAPYAHVKRIAVSGNMLQWRFDEHGADVAVADITDILPLVEEHGVLVKYIPVDAAKEISDLRCVLGTTTLDRKDWKQAGIVPGVKMTIICGENDVIRLMNGKTRTWKAPYSVKSGVMISASAPFLVDVSVKSGNSGSPVFATATIDGKRKRLLCGLVTRSFNSDGKNMSLPIPIEWAKEAISHGVPNSPPRVRNARRQIPSSSNMVGYEVFPLKQGRNVILSNEDSEGAMLCRRDLTIGSADNGNYRKNDRLEWKSGDEIIKYTFNGKGWEDSEGEPIDKLTIPFTQIECAVLTRESPDETSQIITMESECVIRR